MSNMKKTKGTKEFLTLTYKISFYSFLKRKNLNSFMLKIGP